MIKILGKSPAFLLWCVSAFYLVDAVADTAVITSDVQAGAFKFQENAKTLADRLTTLTHHKTTVTTIEKNHQPLYVVKVMQVAEGNEMESISDQLSHIDDKPAAAPTPAPAKVVETITPDKSVAPEKAVAPKKALTPEKTAEKKIEPPRPIYPRDRSSDKGKRIWNLRNADIHAVIEEVGRETGKNFVVDPRVEGKITIIANTPVSTDQLYAVFLSALQVNGYGAQDSGKVVKIVPLSDNRAQGARVANSANPGRGDEMVVRVVPVNYTSAIQLIPVLRPLMPQWSDVSAYTPTNSLIISGPAQTISQMLDIIAKVDTPEHDDISIIPLKNAIADDVLKTLKSLLEGERRAISSPVTVAADDTSNSILLSGNPAERTRIRSIIRDLDTPASGGIGSHTQVIYLQYLQAQDLVPVLGGVAHSVYNGPVGTTIGTSTVKNAPPVHSHMHNSQDAMADVIVDTPYTQSQHTNEAKTSEAQAKESGKPMVEIIGEPNTNSIIINGPGAVIRTLKSVIARLDIRPEQVMVEALVAEIDEEDINTLGFQWGTVTHELNESGSTASAVFNPGFAIVNRGGFDELEARITALATDNKATILSTPSVVVLDNQLAHIKVGKEVSVLQSNYPGNGFGTTPATPYNTFDREDVALILNVVPQITNDNTIKLSIAHNNNTLEDPSDNTGRPIFNVSEITTSVIVGNGDTLVLGGLIQDGVADAKVGTPLLSKVPLFGRIFSNPRSSHTRKKLMVFLHPVILSNREDNLRVSGSKYEFMRHAQLDQLREHSYNIRNNEAVLPTINHDVELPPPFLPYRHYHK